MAVDPRPYRRRKLPYAGMYLAELLEENDKPVVDPLDFFRITRRMYREGAGKRLFLRPHDSSYHARLQYNLKKARVIRLDRDYEKRGFGCWPSQTFQRKTLPVSWTRSAISPISLLCSDGD